MTTKNDKDRLQLSETERRRELAQAKRFNTLAAKAKHPTEKLRWHNHAVRHVFALLGNRRHGRFV